MRIHPIIMKNLKLGGDWENNLYSSFLIFTFLIFLFSLFFVCFLFSHCILVFNVGVLVLKFILIGV